LAFWEEREHLRDVIIFFGIEKQMVDERRYDEGQ